MAGLAFDSVSIKKWLGSKMISAADFMAMPKDQRLKLITSGKVTFVNAGVPVDLMVAVQSIAEQNS